MIISADDLFDFMKGNASVFVGTDVATNREEQARLQVEAAALLQENGKAADVLDDKIVFLMHQGYVFSCVKRSCVYGPVFTYAETLEMAEDFKNLHDLVDAYR